MINNGLESPNISSRDGLSKANARLMTNMEEYAQQAGADIDEIEK